MDKQRAEQILTESEALLNGHFILTSGKHSDRYMQCAKVLQYPKFASELAKSLVDEFKNDGIEVVIAPATGGIIISYEIASQLGCKNLFAEREDGKMTLRRGFEIKKGAKVLVTEDVVTTGGTVFEVIDLVKEAGGEVAGVAVFVDRSLGKVDFGVKTRSAYQAEITAYEPGECPLCKEGKTEAVKPGSRSLK